MRFAQKRKYRALNGETARPTGGFQKNRRATGDPPDFEDALGRKIKLWRPRIPTALSQPIVSAEKLLVEFVDIKTIPLPNDGMAFRGKLLSQPFDAAGIFWIEFAF
jgi:hypothetical protein